MKTNFPKALFSLVLFSIISIHAFATSYTWTGATSTSWATSTNWSPAGVPSTSDVVSISNQTNNPQLTSNKTVSQLTINSGTLNLNSYTLTISSKSYFYGGAINNGLIFSLSAISVYFSGAAFGAKINMGGQAIYLNGSTFNDSISLIKTSKSNINSKGGNTFNGYFYYENNTRASIVLSDSLPDIYNSTFVINNIDTGTFYISHRGIGNQFNGDVYIHGKKIYFNYYGTATFSGNIHFYSPAGEIYFGYSTGSSTLVSGKTIVLDSTISSGNLYFQNFTKSGSGSMNFTLAGSSHLYFKGGTIFNSALTCSAPNMHLDGARFLGTSSFTNNATANVTSLGGNYFGGATSIINNSSSSNTFSLGNTVTDTFATATTIQNNTGLISINNAIFNSSVSLINNNLSTASNTFFLSNTGQCKFKGALTINNNVSAMVFATDGSTILDENGTVDIIDNTSGIVTIKNFTQIGNASVSYISDSLNSKLILDGGNTFNGNFTFKGRNIEVKGTTFNGNVNITKYGSSDVSWYGGNVFNSTTTIKDSSTSGHYLKLENSSPDYFNGNVTFKQMGAGLLYPACDSSAYFTGNVSIDSSSTITFGANGGKAIFNGTSMQSINQSLSSAPVVKKLKINKSSETLTLNSSITISDSLILQNGIINTNNTNIISISDNGKTTGASNASFINGPLSKIGNDAFTFPLGSKQILSGKYHPISITAPSGTSDKITAEYINGYYYNLNPIDSVAISSTEYWRVFRTTGTNSLEFTLGWNSNSSEVWDLDSIYVIRFDGTSWNNFGGKNINHNDSVGSVTSNSSVNLNNGVYNIFTLGGPSCRISRLGGEPNLYRGLYVDKFLKLNNDGTVNTNKTILGDETKENELLKFACDNNFKALTLYDIRTVFNNYNNHYNKVAANDLYKKVLCDFVKKAKQQYCIELIAIAGESKGFFNNINGTDVLNITEPYTFPSSSFFYHNNPLQFVTHQYTSSDNQTDALRSERAKYYLASLNFNGDCDFKIDIMTTEYEFWDASCKDDQDEEDCPVEHDDPNVANDCWCDIDAQWAEYKQLLNDMAVIRTASVGTHPLLIEVYLGWFNKIPTGEDAHTMVDFIDSKVDMVDLHAYTTSPSSLWGFIDDRVFLFGNNHLDPISPCPECANTIIRPILSNEHEGDTGHDDPTDLSDPFLGSWLDLSSPQNTIYSAERKLLTDLTGVEDNVFTKGAFLWFTYTFFDHKNSSSTTPPDMNWNYDCTTNNETFYGDGKVSICSSGSHTITGCKNGVINFNYVGNYEAGVKCDWYFGDLTTSLDHEPSFPSSPAYSPDVMTHQYQHPGDYIVTCITKFPDSHFPNKDGGLQTCRDTFIRNVKIYGADITASIDPPEICDGDNIILTVATNDPATSTYSWSPGTVLTTSTRTVTPNTTTTYTVTVNSANDCNTTATYTVTVKPKPSITISGTNITCNGGNDGKATASGGDTYLWSNGASTATIDNLVAGNYTCTATGTNGCTSSSSVTITQPAAIAIITSQTNIDCYGSSTGRAFVDQISGGTSPYTYVWQSASGIISTTNTISSQPAGTYTLTVADINGCTGNATVILSQPSTLSVSVSPTANNCSASCNGSVIATVTGGTSNYSYLWNGNSAATTSSLGSLCSGIYTVSITDAHDCVATASGTIIMNDNDCGTADMHFCTGESSSYLDTWNFTTTGTLTNKTINVHSDFTINSNLTLVNCTLKIEPNVKITIATGKTLTVTSSSLLEACSNRWQGIVLSSATSHLIVEQNSIIRDAIKGVDASNSAEVDISNASFINNITGVYFHNGSFSSSSVVHTMFDGNNALNTIGIHMQSITGLTIDGGANKNTFQNMDVGIRCSASTATLQRCVFNGLYNYSCTNAFNRSVNSFGPTCQLGQGSGIFATDYLGVPNITVGGSTNTKCEFINCTYGIFCFINATINAQYNTFNNSGYTNSNPSFGIISWHSTNTTKYIAHNNFNFIENGINITDPLNETLTIENNNFNHTGSVPSIPNRIAINLGSTTVNASGDRIISNNHIDHYYRGILVTNQDNMNTTGISGNIVVLDNITTDTIAEYGLAVQGGSHNTISHNTVSSNGDATSDIEQTLYGISIENSENNLVNQNTLNFLGTGLRYLGASHPNAVSCNSLAGNYRQITMEGADVGDQGNSSESSDNKWDRLPGTNANLCEIGISANRKWWVRNYAPYYPGTGSGEMYPFQFTFRLDFANPSINCPSPCDPACIQDIFSKKLLEYSESAIQFEYIDQQSIFQALYNDTSLLHLNTANDSILQAFYQPLKNGNIGNFVQIKDQLRKNNLPYLELANDVLVPENNIEENEQTFNTIYINTWRNNNFALDSTAQAILMELANQNPLSGGTSVYGARVMLNLDVSDNYIEPVERLKNPKAKTSILKANSIGKIIPNPNSGLMEYQAILTPKTKGLLEIYDLIGNLVKSFILYPEVKQLKIDLSDFAAGIYPYRIILDNTDYGYDKIVLQK